MKERLMRFMQGRYGVDQLSKFLLIVGLIVVFGSALVGEGLISVVFYILGWAIGIYCYVRTFSRNVSKRYAENRKISGSRDGIIIFIHVRHASRRSVFREEKERSRYAVRSAVRHLLRRAEQTLAA